MTTMIKLLAFTLMAGLASQAVAWPNVVSQVAGTPGKWSSAYTKTRDAAKKAALPCMVVFADSAETTANAEWNTGVLEDSQWTDWLEDNRLYLVMLDKSTTNVTFQQWWNIAKDFADKDGWIYLPQVVIFDPSGRKVTQFCADGDLAEADVFIERIENLVLKYPNVIKPGPGRIGFTTEKQSVNATASNVVVTVTRSGGTAQGAQTFLLQTHDGTASNGVHYAEVSTNLMWAAGDSSSRSVSIPLLNQTNGWAQAGAYSFGVTLAKGSNTTAEVGTTNLTVSITGCFTIGDNWYIDTDSGALRTHPLTNGLPTEIVWTAPQAGLFTSIWGNSNGVVEVLIDNTLIASNRNSGTMSMNTVAVNAGKKLVWRASGTNCMATVNIWNWEPLETPTLISPPNNKSFQLEEVRADTSLLNLTWQTATNLTTAFHVLTVGKVIETNAMNGVNAVGLGAVQTDKAPGWVSWSLRSGVNGDFGTTAIAASPTWKFEVTAKPSFPMASTNVACYLNLPIAFQFTAMSSASAITGYSAKGLPSGLKINTVTGEVSGTPKKVGRYEATITAKSKSDGSAGLPVTVEVMKLPDHVTGSFQGMLLDAADKVCGVFTLTVSTAGVPSLKLETGGKSQTMRGAWLPDTDGETFTARFTSKTIPELNLNVMANGVEGVMDGGVTLMAQPILKNAEARPYVKYYTTVFDVEEASPFGDLNNAPEGYGYLTFTVTEKTGSVKYSGKLADGTSVSGSAGLISGDDPGTAVFPIYKPLYSKRGEVAARVTLSQDITNTVAATNSVWYYPGKSKTLTNDAFIAELQGVGAEYVKKPVSLAWLDGMILNADGTNAYVSATEKKVTLENANGVKLSVTASSGLFSGSFRDATGKSRSFKGALIPLEGWGGGYWLYPDPDPAAAGYRLNRSRPVTIIEN